MSPRETANKFIQIPMSFFSTKAGLGIICVALGGSGNFLVSRLTGAQPEGAPQIQAIQYQMEALKLAVATDAAKKDEQLRNLLDQVSHLTEVVDRLRDRTYARATR
jgi:hypothetical protein